MRAWLPQEEWRGEVIHLSWAPRAFLVKNFLSDEECDHLIQKVRGITLGCNPWLALPEVLGAALG